MGRPPGGLCTFWRMHARMSVFFHLSQLDLQCHASSPVPEHLVVRVGAAWTAAGELALSYRLVGASASLRIPAPGSPARVDGLWRHTCFEAFILGADAPAYREYNFSPSGAWQAYAFRGYREGGLLDMSTAPRIQSGPGNGAGLDVLLPAPLLPAGARLRLGLSAVIEAVDGTLSYWALRHPPGRPDFHHPDCFVLEFAHP